MIAAMLLAQASLLLSSPELGKAEGVCRPNEPGPAIMITVKGLKDRVGLLRAELYPDNDEDFLADDNVLLSQGKTFARVDMPVLADKLNILCIRVPRPGRYALTLLHDRNSDHRFSLSIDGIGFASNPQLGWSKPKAAEAEITAGAGLTHTSITLNYHRGLHMRPLEAQ